MPSIRLLILAVCGVLLARGQVRVDRENLRAEIAVSVPGGSLSIYLEPASNLILHTTSLYGLFDGQGAGYALLDDVAAKRAVDPRILAALGGKDRRYSARGAANVFTPTFRAFLDGHLYEKPPDLAAWRAIAPAVFGEALEEMWRGFYRDYWTRRFEALASEFRQMSDNVRWAEMLGRMEQLTGRRWRGEMRIFAVEATGKSALTFGRDVCIGTVGAGEDAGFVHEGLHLLLDEAWAKSPRIAALMADAGFRDRFWGARWAAMYEQAVVVLFETHLRGKRPRKPGMTQDEFLRLNLEGNLVGGFADIAMDTVGGYLKAPDGHFEDLMWRLVSRAEERRRAGQGVLGLNRRPLVHSSEAALSGCAVMLEQCGCRSGVAYSPAERDPYGSLRRACTRLFLR